MSAHALLSPSSAHRWISCPGSVALSERIERDTGERTSVYANEGTLAHEVAEVEAALAFDLITPAQHVQRLLEWRTKTPDEYHDDMLRHAAAYVAVLKQLREGHPHSQVMLEQKVDTGVPASWGTLDAAIIAPKHLQVVDYKYGAGIRVEADHNEQLMLYALGGLDLFADICEPETVCMTIHQPRMGHTSHWCTTPQELRQWRDQIVKPAAALAVSGEGYFLPSEDACRWCPASGDCRARVEFMTKREFGDPDLLSMDEMGTILAQIPDIEGWCRAVRERALELAYRGGQHIPGWKVIRAGGRRHITDQDQAIKILVGEGYPREKVARESARTLGELERLVGGKAALGALLGPLLEKAEGKEALVPEQDERPAIDVAGDAGRDFSDTP